MKNKFVQMRSLRRAGMAVGCLSLLLLGGPALLEADSSETDFLSENDVAMMQMHKAMHVKPSGDVDRDFVAMMVPHHQGAIDMAKAVLHYGKNEQIRRLAQEIIIEQQQEITAMQRAVQKEVSR